MRTKVPFKGSRTYLWGPDIYNVLFDHLSSVTTEPLRDLKFVASNFISSNIVELGLFSGGEAVDPKNWPMTLSAQTDAGVISVAVQSAPDADAATLSIPFDEAPLRATVAVDGGEATAPPFISFTPVEQIVSVNKLLMETIFPEMTGLIRWTFARAEFHCTPPVPKRSIRLTCANTQPARIYKSLVEIDDEAIGAIYFMGIKT